MGKTQWMDAFWSQRVASGPKGVWRGYGLPFSNVAAGSALCREGQAIF